MAVSSHLPDVASGRLKNSDDQIAASHNDLPSDAHRLGGSNTQLAATTQSEAEAETDGVESGQDGPTSKPASRRGPRGFLTSRGAFIVILVATSAACVAGFLISSAAVIPAVAGWFLAISSLAAATVIREKDKLMAIWLPPMVMALVIAVLGQITLLGTSPTIAREVSMFLAAMASAAPAQVVAVTGAFLIVRWRYPKARKTASKLT